ncbi:MAG: sugar ABC transporter substrate-binding protein [Clostridiales bacterium]|nr:sugar ABC transporter substrate-binding protein [Clostridiales bacterium]
MKRFLSVLLTLAMLLSLVSVSAVAEGKELLTIDVYDDAANYNGIQSGWFAKLIKDKFNIELNIIASQVVGNTIYATRSEEGNLGDILIVDKSKFPEIVEAGLAKDISDKLPECSNIMVFKTQIDAFNKGLTGVEGKYYGIPTEMTDTSPTTVTDDVIYSSPMLRWDLYKQIGSPKLANLNDLLDALAKIHEIHPANEEGDPAYPFTLWADWDNNDNMSGPANVVQLTTWYGQKLKGSAMLMPDNTFKKLYERDSAYYTITKFLNQANQRGLVDPDSGTQNWDSVMNKLSTGRADMMWYSWETGFWNNVERLNAGTAFRFIPVEDQTYYADADRYFGSDRMFGIGAKVEGEKYDRIMEFLDWYASPEGATFQHDGIEGLNYIVGEDGKFVPYKDDALMNNLPVPEEYGGGGYNDGNNAINQWIVSSICVNPKTGERYAQKYWKSYKDMTMTEMKKEWSEMYGAEDDVAWMKANGKLLASPSVDFTPAPDDNTIAATRADVNKCLCEYTWNLIMTCSTDEEFEAMWDEMITQLDGFGYNELFEHDKAVWQPEVDAKVAAAAAAQ